MQREIKSHPILTNYGSDEYGKIYSLNFLNPFEMRTRMLAGTAVFSLRVDGVMKSCRAAQFTNECFGLSEPGKCIQPARVRKPRSTKYMGIQLLNVKKSNNPNLFYAQYGGRHLRTGTELQCATAFDDAYEATKGRRPNGTEPEKKPNR